MSEAEAVDKVRTLIKGIRVAMLTHVEQDGQLISRPMATQDVDFDGNVQFIGTRSSDQVRAIERNPQVNVAYSSDGAWVSLSGTARITNDEARLKELWSSFTDSWLDGGPENPDNVLIEIDADTAQYTDAPGNSKIASLANLIKSKVTGETIEGDSGEVDLNR